MCEVEIIYRVVLKRIVLPVDAIRGKDKHLIKVLAANGVTFFGGGFTIWCEKFSEQISKSVPLRRYLDFYQDENLCWRHSASRDIAEQATDSQGILERLGIDLSELTEDSFVRLTLFLYGIAGNIFVVLRRMNIIPLAKLAIAHSEYASAFEDIKRIFCDENNPPVSSMEFTSGINQRNTVILISVTGTEHMNRKCFKTLEQTGASLASLPIFLAESDDVFGDKNDIMCLNYDITGMGSIKDMLFWAVRQLLTERELALMIEKIFVKYSDKLGSYTETNSMRNLVSLLMALAQVYLPRLGAGDRLVSVLERYYIFLIDSAYSSSQVTIDRFKLFLISRRDIPVRKMPGSSAIEDNVIYIKDNIAAFRRSTFDYTALKCGANHTTLVECLRQSNVLVANKRTNMLNIRINDRTERFYAIDCEKLFEPGELRPMCDDDKGLEPLYRLRIGTAGSFDIFFDIYSTNSQQSNSFAFITGTTGTGKSTLGMVLIREAVAQGMSVIMLGLERSVFDLKCNIFGFREDNAVSVNNFFDALYTVIDEDEICLAETAKELMLENSYSDYEKMLNDFIELVDGDGCTYNLLSSARQAAEALLDFSWDKAIKDGEISRVIANSTDHADSLLSDFFDYKSKQPENSYTLLMLDEAQNFSWNGKSPMVSKILREGRKFGIVGIIATQFLNAENGKNIATVLKQIETHFAFQPSDEITAMKQLGYTSDNMEAREVLKFLDVGEVLAKGHLSTNKCALDYPVRIKVDCERSDPE